MWSTSLWLAYYLEPCCGLWGDTPLQHRKFFVNVNVNVNVYRSPPIASESPWPGVVHAHRSLCPWSMLSKGFNDLGLAANGNNPGLRWGNRYR